MIQNMGALIMYIGGALCILFVLCLFRLRVLAYMGKINFTKKKFFLTLMILLIGIVCIFAGESLRKSMSKDLMLSYYKSNLSYEELTPAQRKNITVALFQLPYDHKNGEDVTVYLHALENYAPQVYKFMGVPDEQAADSIARLMKQFED